MLFYLFHPHLEVKHDTLTLLKPSGYFVCHKMQHKKILRSAHTLYLCVLYGSENEQRLFPYTALTDWFV